jgi:hypothetical protein
MAFKNSFKLPKTMWAGFTEDRIDLDAYRSPGGKWYGILYTSRAQARESYHDVRRVSVMQCPPRSSSTTKDSR